MCDKVWDPHGEISRAFTQHPLTYIPKPNKAPPSPRPQLALLGRTSKNNYLTTHTQCWRVGSHADRAWSTWTARTGQSSCPMGPWSPTTSLCCVPACR